MKVGRLTASIPFALINVILKHIREHWRRRTGEEIAFSPQFKK
jgi:hypothetical protein